MATRSVARKSSKSSKSVSGVKSLVNKARGIARKAVKPVRSMNMTSKKSQAV